MKKSEILSVALMSASCLVSCSQDNITETENLQNEANNVERILNKFCHEQQTTRGSEDFPHEVKVTRIVTDHYVYNGKESHLKHQTTRAEGVEFDLSCVEFFVNGKNGYAMISDTPGVEGVYLFSMGGCLADTATNPGLTYAIENLRDGLGAELAGNYIKPDPVIPGPGDPIPVDSTVLANTQYGPFIKTRWHQENPFNNRYPMIGSDRASAGCVNVALGQLIAYSKRFANVLPENKNIDFDALTSQQVPTDIFVQMQAGWFIFEISEQTHTVYGYPNSSASVGDASAYLKKLGYGCETKNGNIDITRLTSLLKQYLPQLYVGCTKAGDCHMWIIDGYRPPRESSKALFHTNWGNKLPGFTDEDTWLTDKCITNQPGMSETYYTKNCTIYITSI